MKTNGDNRTLDQRIGEASQRLPDGFELRINVDSHAAWVELYREDGEGELRRVYLGNLGQPTHTITPSDELEAALVRATMLAESGTDQGQEGNRNG